MLVVLTILGLVLGIIVTRGPMRSERLSLEAATREMAGSLRLARGRAIAQNREVLVAVSPTAYQVDRGAPQKLPAQIAVTSSSRIAFEPDGSSSGGQIIMQSGARKTTLIVDWLTGRVRVAGVDSH